MKAIMKNLTCALLITAAALGTGWPQSGGKGDETSPTSPLNALNGNWHLIGVDYYGGLQISRKAADVQREGNPRLPFISLAIETDGNQIWSRGSVQIGCQNSQEIWSPGGTFTGKIAPDGTFEIGDSKAQLSIHGTVPQSGDRSWQGTYTLKNLSPDLNCIVDESGVFTATKYPSLTGTYSGTIGKGLAVTLQITQGEPERYSHSVGHSIPLGGQITIFGLPCFTHGTATKKRSHRVEGETFYLRFSMEDGGDAGGAVIQIFGNLEDRVLEDSVESTIDVDLHVLGGHCWYGGGSGTLILR